MSFTFPALNVTHIMSSCFALNLGLRLKPSQSIQKPLLWIDLSGLTLQSARLHWSLGTPEGVNALPRLFLAVQIAEPKTQVQGNRTHSAKRCHLGINYGSWHHWVLLLVQLLLKGPCALFTPPGCFEVSSRGSVTQLKPGSGTQVLVESQQSA